MITATVTREDYLAAYIAEREMVYPVVDALEERLGYALPQRWIEAALTLACPLKANPPNWQHGRVLYAVTRNYLEAQLQRPTMTLLDIGTAKGFSALCLRAALTDAGMYGDVISVDVIDPQARVRRNTIAEVDGLKTLHEILKPWPESTDVQFVESTGIDWLERHPGRVDVAFVDGKHSGHVVRREGVLLSERQQSGDLAIFDDVHLPDVSQAVTSLHHEYQIEYLTVLPKRAYALAVRR